jgi:hypothetical protein
MEFKTSDFDFIRIGIDAPFRPASHREKLAMAAEANEKLEKIKKACELYKEASYQSHSGHWDSTGQHGAGCPECIRARELRDKADKILKNHR